MKICVGYQNPDGTISKVTPLAAEGYELVTPVYETMPGWSESTFGATSIEQLPPAAINYIKRLEELLETPIDIISTGPDRNETMILVNPFN